MKGIAIIRIVCRDGDLYEKAKEVNNKFKWQWASFESSRVEKFGKELRAIDK